MPEQTQRRSAISEPLPLVTGLEALLYRHDPVGIAFGDNPDEYRPEASNIAARLDRAGCVDDVRSLVREEFARWFGEDPARDADRFDGIAHEVWALRREHSSAPS